MKEMGDANEIAETFMEMDYDSDWDADTFLINFKDALDAELDARAENCTAE